MLEAIRTYKIQNTGGMRFIGNKYSDGETAWREWKAKGLFESVKQQIGINLANLHEDSDALVGLMSHRNGFEYWLGYFTPENTPVPEGLDHEDFSKFDMAVCWFYEKDEFNPWDLAPEGLANIEKAGYTVTTDWWFERYSSKRCKDFYAKETPDDTIMDIGYFVV